MKIKEIKLQIQTLTNKINKCYTTINEIQNKCKHYKNYIEIAHGSNIGNWDSSDNYYYTDYHCTICNKQWRKYS